MPASQTTVYDLASDLIREGEGERLLAYEDSNGYVSIGVGRNLDTKGISEAEMEFMLHNDIRDGMSTLEDHYFYYNQNDVRKAVLLDLHHNLGLYGLLGFQKMIAALVRQDYDQAAYELLDSKYATQVGQRAVRNAELLRKGSFDDSDD